MSWFTDNAASILETAETARQTGDTASHTTILIGRQGQIRIVSDSDSSLASLQSQHRAETAYRVEQIGQKIRVEGRTAFQSCVIESRAAQKQIAQLMLRDRVEYELVAPVALLTA